MDLLKLLLISLFLTEILYNLVKFLSGDLIIINQRIIQGVIMDDLSVIIIILCVLLVPTTFLIIRNNPREILGKKNK